MLGSTNAVIGSGSTNETLYSTVFTLDKEINGLTETQQESETEACNNIKLYLDGTNE